jgi:hypothetical protein
MKTNIQMIIARVRERFAPVDLVLFSPAAAALIYAFLN